MLQKKWECEIVFKMTFTKNCRLSTSHHRKSHQLDLLNQNNMEKSEVKDMSNLNVSEGRNNSVTYNNAEFNGELEGGEYPAMPITRTEGHLFETPSARE